MTVKADIDLANSVFDSEVRRQSLETSKPIVDQFFDHYFWAICAGDYNKRTFGNAIVPLINSTYDLDLIVKPIKINGKTVKALDLTELIDLSD